MAYVLVHSILDLVEKKENENKENYQNIIRAQKAAYLLLKKRCNDLEEKMVLLGETQESITEDMINSFAVCGTPDQIMDKIIELEHLGVNEFVVGSPIGKDKLESLKLLEDVINSF